MQAVLSYYIRPHTEWKLPLADPVIAILKQLQVHRVLKAILYGLWFITPFWTWAIIERILKQSFFIFPYAIPGIILMVFGTAVLATQTFVINRYDFVLMKRIENAAEVFANPSNPAIAKRYSEELDKLILPYLYQIPLVLSSGLLEMTPLIVLNQILFLYLSYSAFTIFLKYYGQLTAFYNSAILVVGISDKVTILNLLVFQYPFLVFVVLAVISLYALHELINKGASAFGVSLRKQIILYVANLFTINTRLDFLGMTIARIPKILRNRKYAIDYKPFVDPASVPLIIQRAVKNVEGKDTNVTMYAELVTSISDCERITDMFRKDRKIPVMLRMLVSKKRSKRIMELIQAVQPVFYLGTLENRCLCLGTIAYIPHERVRTASFYFDSKYLKDEFVTIMSKEIEKQRELSGTNGIMESILGKAR